MYCFSSPPYSFRNPRDPAGKERPLILGTMMYPVRDGAWQMGFEMLGAWQSWYPNRGDSFISWKKNPSIFMNEN